jgi:hypothetical protein
MGYSVITEGGGYGKGTPAPGSMRASNWRFYLFRLPSNARISPIFGCEQGSYGDFIDPVAAGNLNPLRVIASGP